jgi:hypothetical protein
MILIGSFIDKNVLHYLQADINKSNPKTADIMKFHIQQLISALTDSTYSCTLPMDCYLDLVGGLVPLRCEEGRPKAVRDKVAGKGQQQNY